MNKICKNTTTRTDGISKLSLANESKIEWTTLQFIKKYLSTIPNYSKYFLISNITTCIPDKLSLSDKESFDKCFSLEQNGIDIYNINNNLHLLKIINMPDGGLNLDIVVNNYLITPIQFNSLMLKLLINAIIPMNKLKIFHFDIKSSNILYKNKNVKIIDFGEIGISRKNNIIPNILFNRAIQFNSPFSRILFTDFIQNYITRLFTRYSIKSNTDNQKKIKIMRQAYGEYVKTFGQGHEIFLQEFLLPYIFKLIPKNLLIKIWNISLTSQINYESILKDWIVNYCSIVIINYFNYKTMTLDKEKYFKEVYSKNVDIYGFITCYIPFIMTQNKNYSENFKLKISNILIKYCFNSEYAVKPIPINKLINDFKEINKIM